MENPRAACLLSSTSSPYSTSSGFQYQRSYQRSYNRKQQRQERSKPRELPTHSLSRIYTVPSIIKTQEPKPVAHKQSHRKATTEEDRKSGNRFALFKGSQPEYVAVTEPYIAFCTEKSWDEGWRPGFLLGSSRSPPEKYTDALKMYKIYKEVWEELPEKAKDYVTYLERITGVQVSILSVGPKRASTILRGE